MKARAKARARIRHGRSDSRAPLTSDPAPHGPATWPGEPAAPPALALRCRSAAAHPGPTFGAGQACPGAATAPSKASAPPLPQGRARRPSRSAPTTTGSYLNPQRHIPRDTGRALSPSTDQPWRPVTAGRRGRAYAAAGVADPPSRGRPSWGAVAPGYSLPACPPRASRASEHDRRTGPSHSPTASETPHQAARPIATHHHAFMSALQRAVTARRGERGTARVHLGGCHVGVAAS